MERVCVGTRCVNTDPWGSQSGPMTSSHRPQRPPPPLHHYSPAPLIGRGGLRWCPARPFWNFALSGTKSVNIEGKSYIETLF